MYDHCKNHPQWVNVTELEAVARQSSSAGAVDDIANLRDDRVFAFRGSHDNCYLEGAMENVANFYRKFIADPDSQIYLNNTLPFPHCLPLNSTPYSGSTTPANYDGPGHCLKWVFQHASSSTDSSSSLASFLASTKQTSGVSLQDGEMRESFSASLLSPPTDVQFQNIHAPKLARPAHVTALQN